MFKRKIYDKMLEWKKTSEGRSALLIEGARRIGKSTVAEEFAKNHREIYDYATSRAVANLSTLTEYLLPFVKIGGKCICMKGPDADNEIENAKFAIKELGGKISFVDKICLPNSDISRTIVIIDKIKDTPKKYPRKAGTPSKQPLGN